MIDEPLRERMAECLALMEEAGLNLYGRELGPATVAAYLAVLMARGPELTDPALMRRAAVRIASGDGDFPTAGAFAAAVRSEWERDHTCIGIFQPDGTLAVRWVSLAEAQALAARGASMIGQECDMPALPDLSMSRKLLPEGE